MARLTLPASCEAMTPAWLTDALGPEALDGATVIGFDIARVGEGVGFMGVVNRLTLQYDRPAPRAPVSVIAKLPSPEAGPRNLAATFRHYEKEVRFYDEVAAQSPIRSARSYFQAFDPESGDFALLLEDLTIRNGDHLAGVTVDEARMAVRALAGLHARWWDRPELDAMTWLPDLEDPAMLVLESVFQQCWGPYRDFFGEAVPEAVRPLGERLGVCIQKMMRALSRRPVTLIHGDYRADNFFFGGADEPFVVIDWQIITKGRGVFDLAYFITGNLSVEDRRGAQDELVRLYHRTLTEAGVEGYSLEACWADFRTCALFGWIWPVVAIASLDPANERGMAVFHEWNRRVCTAIQDLDAGAMLAPYES